MKISAPVRNILVLAVICIATFYCFRYTLGNQFTLWDDDYYVTNNVYIRSFCAENLKVLFTQDVTKNNYHPLCLLSLAVNYAFSGLNPSAYYLTNVLIHMANAILVFFLFIQLCRRLKMADAAGFFIATFGALWFAIHPMHVESVAWIAERKDVLYTFFYVLGLLTYLRYTDAGEKKWYWLTFLLFVLSCLSKPMAVVFPMSLLCVDVLLQRQGIKKLLLEKVIFFGAALFFGGLAFYTQHRNGAVASFDALTLSERIMYAGYGFLMYIWKLFVPANLSTFYPYPYRYITGSLPVIYYVAPFLALAVALLPGWLLWKRKSPFFRIYAFGMGFFIANIVFVLQFISVGSAIMADRYSYVAYIGLLFLVAYLVQLLVQKMPSLRLAVVVVLMFLSGGLAAMCYERTKVWHDSRTLLSDAIQKYPYRALLSYKWRGNFYYSIGEYDSAMMDFGLLESIHAADAKVKAKIEHIQLMKGLGSAAIPMGQRTVDAAGGKLYLDSVYTSLRAGDTLGAFRKYVVGYSKDPGIEKAIAANSFDLVQAGSYPQAIRQYDLLLKLNTGNAFYYFYRGVCYFGTGKLKEAIADWEIGVKMDSRDVQQSASYDLSVAYDSIGEAKKAYYYVTKAKSLGYNTSPDFVEKLRRKSEAAQKK